MKFTMKQMKLQLYQLCMVSENASLLYSFSQENEMTMKARLILIRTFVVDSPECGDWLDFATHFFQLEL